MLPLHARRIQEYCDGGTLQQAIRDGRFLKPHDGVAGGGVLPVLESDLPRVLQVRPDNDGGDKPGLLGCDETGAGCSRWEASQYGAAFHAMQCCDRPINQGQEPAKNLEPGAAAGCDFLAPSRACC